MMPAHALKACSAAVLGAAALALGGCGPLISLGNDGPADDIYTLDYQGAMAPELHEGPLLYFDEPHVAEGLSSQKVAVRLGSHKRTALAGARWSAGLSTLVRDYLTRSLAAQADARAIGEGGLDVKVDCRLAMKIWSFDFVPGAAGTGNDKVDVTIELTLIRLRDGQLISQHMFSETPSVAGTSGDDVAEAFNAAMAVDSAAMAKWLKPLKDQCLAGGS